VYTAIPAGVKLEQLGCSHGNYVVGRDLLGAQADHQLLSLPTSLAHKLLVCCVLPVAQ
jgi:hypothetical protein